MPLGSGRGRLRGRPAGSDGVDEGHGLAQDADIGGFLALIDHGIVLRVVLRHQHRLPLAPELAYRSSNSKFRCAVLQDMIVAKTKIASANNISINCNGKRSRVFKNSNPGR